MEGIDRRSALSLGLVASAIPLLAFSRPAQAQVVPSYSPTDGEEIAPGVRAVEVGSQASRIPGYSSIKITDLVFQPGVSFPPEGTSITPMGSDMVCFIAAGTFSIAEEGGETFEVKEGEFYTCGKGAMEVTTNIGDTVGIHRIAMLMQA